jgi:two-component system CheB/CheR fusion protein
MSHDAENRHFDALLGYLQRTRGFDFSAYKRPSLMRRILRRMQHLNIEGFATYTDYLEVHPDEFPHLFNTILINVTAFFRDAAAWDYLATHVLPRVIADKGPDEPIRVWSAGCASGEEAYSLAMLFAEALGVEAFRNRVKVYASNVDEDALNVARLASYPAKGVEDVPEALRDKYFEKVGEHFVFHKDLRRSVISGRHDLIHDAPISRVDLLVCRNTLMYFNAEAQSKILARFHFALGDTGYLFLGRAEMLLTHGNLFTAVDLKQRIFQKVPRVNMRDRLLIMAQTGREDVAGHVANHIRVRETAFEVDPNGQVIFDVTGHLVLANEAARLMFGLTPKDIGRPLQELQLSYRPVEMRNHFELVLRERRPVFLREVAWSRSEEPARFYDLLIVPLPDGNNGAIGVKTTYVDVTRQRQLQTDLHQARQELETTREELQTVNEELESSNEELETTNEELQSTNEELETMNEELQSTNEELRTMNEELSRRGEELNQVNSFLESILTSLRAGVAVLDKNLRVEVWNHNAENLWGLRAEEAQGKNFLNLDIGLPAQHFRQAIRQCLAGERAHVEETVSATNRRGRVIDCKVTCSPLIGTEKAVRGVILLMEERDGAPGRGKKEDKEEKD